MPCQLALAQHLAMHLAGRGLGQLVDQGHMARVFVLAQLGLDQLLDFAGEGGDVGRRAGADDEGLDDLAAQRVGHTDHRGLERVGVHQDHVLDLDGAHGPARGNDHVVGAAAVIEVAVGVDAAQVLGRQPLAAAQHHQLAGDAGRAGLAVVALHLHLGARNGLAERAFLDREIGRAGVAGQHHADLGRAVHAADFQAEGGAHEVGGVVVYGLAGERQLLQRKAVVAGLAAVLHHAVVGGGRRHVGEAVLGQALQQALGVEAPAVGAHREAQRQRRKRAMPQPMAPGRRRRAEVALAGAYARAVKRGHHQRHQRLVRMLDGFGQLACRARGVLEHRQVRCPGLRLVAGGKSAEGLREPGVKHLHRRVAGKARGLQLLGIGDQQRGLAVLHPQPYAVGAEQREQRHGNRAALDHAEHRGVEGARRLEHDRHPVAGLHAAGLQPVRQPRRVFGQLGKADDFLAAAGLDHDQRVPARGRMAVHAFMGNVQRIAVSVKQVPEPFGGKLDLRIGVALVVGQ